MTVETELKILVGLYSVFDPDKGLYITQPDSATLLKLDKDFNSVINKLLLIDVLEKDDIKENYLKLVKYFHPNYSSSFLPEVAWLERNLSEGKNNGICSKTLDFCFEKLTEPQKFKEINFKDIQSRDEFKLWLENLKEGANTYTGISFYTSLIGLLEQADDYFDEVGHIETKGLRVIMTIIPVILASYGALMFAEEIFAVYALFIILLKSGNFLDNTESWELQYIGRSFQEMSITSATATTTLLVRLLEMAFWITRQCYEMSLSIGIRILNPFLPSPSKSEGKIDFNPNYLMCKELITVSQNLQEGIQFNSPELKIVATPLEARLKLIGQQYLGFLREGHNKKLEIKDLLFKLQLADTIKESPHDKLLEAKIEILNFKENSKAYTKGGKTAEAIDEAEKRVILLLEQTNTLQKVLYKKNELSDTKLDLGHQHSVLN